MTVVDCWRAEELTAVAPVVVGSWACSSAMRAFRRSSSYSRRTSPHPFPAAVQTFLFLNLGHAHSFFRPLFLFRASPFFFAHMYRLFWLRLAAASRPQRATEASPVRKAAAFKPGESRCKCVIGSRGAGMPSVERHENSSIRAHSSTSRYGPVKALSRILNMISTKAWSRKRLPFW